MANLTHASRELFRRTPDERFASLDALTHFCRQQKEQSLDRWHLPQQLQLQPVDGELVLRAGSDGAYQLNDWSFSQLCSLAKVGKDTVNRLYPETAAKVFSETLPVGQKPLQVLTTDTRVRSIHGVSYTRLWNIDLVNLIREYAVDFTPPQEGCNGATGLYAGEQDLFAFLIDPAGWAEIDGQAFAPGFFVWNSEVGKRSVGISTFWFQSICQNHIVWDAVEIVDIQRKHTANVGDALREIRWALDQLIAKRDARRDGFVTVMQKAMHARVGDDADEITKKLIAYGITRPVIKSALELARQQGRFTIFALVDALTRVAQQCVNAGDRLQLDQKAAQLLNLAA
jgi:hypothetical protein